MGYLKDSQMRHLQYVVYRHERLSNISFIFGFRAVECIDRLKETMAWDSKATSNFPPSSGVVAFIHFLVFRHTCREI